MWKCDSFIHFFFLFVAEGNSSSDLQLEKSGPHNDVSVPTNTSSTPTPNGKEADGPQDLGLIGRFAREVQSPIPSVAGSDSE